MILESTWKRYVARKLQHNVGPNEDMMILSGGHCNTLVDYIG